MALHVLGTGDFFASLPWLCLPMEGFECLSLAGDDLDDDPVLSYTMEQLRHREVS
jgi:hypothetical protein